MNVSTSLGNDQGDTAVMVQEISSKVPNACDNYFVKIF